MRKRPILALSCLLVFGLTQAALGELVGHWTLDEVVGGKIVDSSGKGNDGTIAAGNPTLIEGVKGGAMEFHGLGAAGGGGDYINCGNDASLDLRNALTISVWLRPGADDPEGTALETAPLAKADATAGWSWQLRYGWGTTTPYMGFQFEISGGRVWVYVNQNLAKDEWCHVAATHDGKKVTCYLNGLPTQSAPMTAIAGEAGSSLLIGSDGWGCDWIGAIDDVQIYSHALTADEIATICPPPRIAKDPNPADGAVGVQAPYVQWKPGYAAVLHEVYFGTTPDLGPEHLVQPRNTALMYWHVPGILPGVTYYWRVDEIEQDGVTVNKGDVWSFTAQAVTAYLPDPKDGATDVSLAPTLAWQPGQAATRHHVYFGADRDAVAQGTTAVDKGEQAETSFAPGRLDSLATYFWRVDELGPTGGVQAGPVWSFTTHLPIDDFESYTDEEGSRIYQTWFDGYSDKSSGSMVGYEEAPFAEQTIVHSGLQSMPLDYNNVGSPFYSEAVREFAPAEDWTVGDVNTLVLHIRGNVRNRVAPVYIIVEDSSKRSATVVHPDPKIAVANRWIEWRIPFDQFTTAGVSMSRVKKLTIGVGDKAHPTAGAFGLLYIDDIYAMKP